MYVFSFMGSMTAGGVPEQMTRETEIGRTIQSVLGADIAAKLRQRNLEAT